MKPGNSAAEALASGAAGAAALTILHEAARQMIPHAPRVDVIGMRGIRRPMEAAGLNPPRGRTLYRMSLGGELASNAAYYALIGLGNPEDALRRGALLGLGAGLGAALLPPVIGLGRQPHRRAPYTHLMTIAWYTFGGLVAGVVARALGRHRA